MEILCFFAGTAFYYYRSVYALFLVGILVFFRPKFRWVLSFLMAIFWCTCHEWLITDNHMPQEKIVNHALLEGYIASIPSHSSNKTQFQFLAHMFNHKPVQTTLMLTCYKKCPNFRAGEYWRIHAKLKQPINMANPGGFDYVNWLRSRHLQWIGTIQTAAILPNYGSKHWYLVLKLRQYLGENLAKMDNNTETLGIVQALTLGLTHCIEKSQWDLFRQTGTTHLIDISGEHIAMIAGLVYWLIKWMWKHCGRWCLYIPAPRIASIGAIIVSAGYAFVAGFAVPTQRSLLACLLMLSRNFWYQRFTGWQTWRYGLLVVLMIEPHSIMMLGFYFSFLAVAILILIAQRFKQTGINKLLLMQIACLVGVMPLSLYWFSYGSVNGLLANILAIPLVSLIIVPLALFITFLSPLLNVPFLYFILQKAILGLLYYLNWVNAFAKLNVQLTLIDAIAPLAMMIAIALLSFFPVLRLVPMAITLAIASFFPKHEKVSFGTTRVDTLDVGQGLAVVVRTQNHVLIYDTGMQFYHSSNIGQLVIDPYLKTLGIKKIDKVVISHPDLDHRGGLKFLSDHYPINELIVDNPHFYHQGVSCHDYPPWQWDGVTFKFFSMKNSFHDKNNHSCVLQISTATRKILLTGDIERPGERYLINTYGQALSSDVLLVPHHGSKTSSSSEFIEQINPKFALLSYGFDNRYRFPHSQAISTYQNRHYPLYNTVACGMIRLDLQIDRQTLACYRK